MCSKDWSLGSENSTKDLRILHRRSNKLPNLPEQYHSSDSSLLKSTTDDPSARLGNRLSECEPGLRAQRIRASHSRISHNKHRGRDLHCGKLLRFVCKVWF